MQLVVGGWEGCVCVCGWGGVKVDFKHIVKQLGGKRSNQVLLLSSHRPTSWFIGQHWMHFDIYIFIY